jgi:hypothetical protein
MALNKISWQQNLIKPKAPRRREIMTRFCIPGITMRRSYLLGFYLMASSIVTTIVNFYPGLDINTVARTSDMIEGTAYKPYVGRILLPVIVKASSEYTPAIIKRKIESACDKSLTVQRFINAFGWDRDYLYEYLVLQILFVLCFIGFAYSLRRLIMIFYDFPRFVADFAPLGAILVIPLYFRYCNYIYDPAVVLLFTLAVLLITTRNRPLYYLAFVLATLNKETSLLLVALFFIRERGAMNGSRLVAHSLAQVLIWLAIRIAITITFLDNPGSIIRFYLLEHNRDFLSSLPSVLLFATIILVHVPLIIQGWRHKPVFLRRGLLLTLIPLMVLAFVFGFVDELRVYYEAYPFIVLLALPTVVRLFGLATETAGKQIPGSLQNHDMT